jgi:hypothetical protein
VTAPRHVSGPTIILRSGRYFDFVNPTVDMIDPGDIAWALARICRFNGHSKGFYSVAQHSVLVASICPRNDEFAGLMHDAAEAYVGDMVSPLKQLCPDFKVVETRVERVIAERFGLPWPNPPSIKHADLRLLRTEQRDLTTGSKDTWSSADDHLPMREWIEPWPSEHAEHVWLDRFYFLCRDVDR